MSLGVLLVATSYPRSETDWQGLFIRRIVDAMAKVPELSLRTWTPPGPLPSAVVTAAAKDSDFLLGLANKGGIAHLLRTHRLQGLAAAAGLLRRLRALYRREPTDILHINWLQNALPLTGLGRRAVIAVLGSDISLLRLPGMVVAMRRVLRSNQCILAPNSSWMTPILEQHFGDLCLVRPVHFGIDEGWYRLPRTPEADPRLWLAITRITEGKIGTLFDWGEENFCGPSKLVLIGPRQQDVVIPEWVVHRGPATPEELQAHWMPSATALISLSRHSEGLPQVMLEAMAAGLPVVASRLPAHEQVIDHGSNGLLVESEDQLRDAVARLGDPAVAEAFGQRGRQKMRENFGTWTDCVNRYRALYEELHD